MGAHRAALIPVFIAFSFTDTSLHTARLG